MHILGDQKATDFMRLPNIGEEIRLLGQRKQQDREGFNWIEEM